MAMGSNVSDLAMARSTLFCAFPSTEMADFMDWSRNFCLPSMKMAENMDRNIKIELPSMKMPDFMDGNAKQSRILWE